MKLRVAHTTPSRSHIKLKLQISSPSLAVASEFVWRKCSFEKYILDYDTRPMSTSTLPAGADSASRLSEDETHVAYSCCGLPADTLERDVIAKQRPDRQNSQST